MCGVRMREDPTRPKEPDPPLTTDREGFREDGEGVICESRDERRPTRPREPDPHSQRTERDSERGERV